MERRMEEAAEAVCPVCRNHCPVSDLQCPRGQAHFGIKAEREEENPSDMTLEDEVILLMRKCGHYLHHNAGRGGASSGSELLSALSEEEKTILADLLKKCVRH